MKRIEDSVIWNKIIKGNGGKVVGLRRRIEGGYLIDIGLKKEVRIKKLGLLKRKKEVILEIKEDLYKGKSILKEREEESKIKRRDLERYKEIIGIKKGELNFKKLLELDLLSGKYGVAEFLYKKKKGMKMLKVSKKRLFMPKSQGQRIFKPWIVPVKEMSKIIRNMYWGLICKREIMKKWDKGASVDVKLEKILSLYDKMLDEMREVAFKNERWRRFRHMLVYSYYLVLKGRTDLKKQSQLFNFEQKVWIKTLLGIKEHKVLKYMRYLNKINEGEDEKRILRKILRLNLLNIVEKYKLKECDYKVLNSFKVRYANRPQKIYFDDIIGRRNLSILDLDMSDYKVNNIGIKNIKKLKAKRRKERLKRKEEERRKKGLKIFNKYSKFGKKKNNYKKSYFARYREERIKKTGGHLVEIIIKK